ncbi:hypothetical protein GPZ80_13035 [Actinokineospora sp. HBU206404]|uniref:Inclusion body protein n=1 Tax=Actinokineospora xionganensis TaxID=2684470 RepID=A0ABR7L5X9_9PSEU|nr:hypothetical protein [Actinokineospora xionganensis]
MARVIAHIERTARWYDDPAAVAGHWVHFEAPLNYLVLDGGPVPGMTLFVDRATQPGSTRLILHCSSNHLRIEGRAQAVAPPAGHTVETADSGGSGAGAITNNIDLLIGLLSAQPSASDGHVVAPNHYAGRHLPGATIDLLRTIDGRTHPETAAWMAGYARVTANFVVGTTRYVIASPLYIEYAPPPRP